MQAYLAHKRRAFYQHRGSLCLPSPDRKPQNILPAAGVLFSRRAHTPSRVGERPLAFTTFTSLYRPPLFGIATGAEARPFFRLAADCSIIFIVRSEIPVDEDFLRRLRLLANRPFIRSDSHRLSALSYQPSTVSANTTVDDGDHFQPQCFRGTLNSRWQQQNKQLREIIRTLRSEK